MLGGGGLGGFSSSSWGGEAGFGVVRFRVWLSARAGGLMMCEVCHGIVDGVVALFLRV